MVNRRDFLGGAISLGAVFAANVGDAKTLGGKLGRERLRFGVLSDIHITTHAQLPYFEKALRKLDEWKADAVLACGDIADSGMEAQLQLAADTWFKVFPKGKGSDGRTVVNLMHYGDHDMQDDRYVDNPDVAAEWPDREMRHKVMYFGDRKASWERCFKEPWAPIVLKEVKGYQFVLSHFTRGEPENRSGNNVPGLEEFMHSHKFDPKKPFFYSQHRIPKNTACGEYVWGQEDGKTTKLFAEYPNLVAFCGHAHINGAYEKSIWQGAFTCVEVPSLRYSVTMGGRENGHCGYDRPPRVPAKPAFNMPVMPSGKTHQGFFCTVYDHAIVIKRWEFEHDLSLGPDWVIPLESFGMPPQNRPFAFANRERESVPPEFPADAKITVGKRIKVKDRSGEMQMMVPVSFPTARPNGAALRADDYEVTCYRIQEDVERIVMQKRVYSPRYLYGTNDDVEPVKCLFTESEVPEGWKYRFEACPLNAFGKRGKAIKS